jgi:magnesium transporter
MSVDHITLSKDMTIKNAIAHIKKTKSKLPIDRLPFNYFVITSTKELVGYVDYESLLLESPTTKLDKVIKTAISIKTRDDIEDAIDIFKKYELETLVVVNSQNRVAGIIESTDIIHAMEDEYMEDIDKLHGITESERKYLSSSARTIAKTRVT